MRRSREHLIPFEQSKRVIRLDRRGKRRNILLPLAVVSELLGVLCLIYCAGIAVSGFGTFFFLIWGLLGLLLLGIGVLLTRSGLSELLPAWLKWVIGGVTAAALLLFLIVEGMILAEFGSQPKPGADYCVILGAQWKENGPSEVLRRRLEAAAVYLEENAETIAIVSGGQGSDEKISEAAGMKQYLCQAGIAEERILMEDQSRNTCENLEFSTKLLDVPDSRVVIVTNNFHAFRALRIAEKQGYRAEGLAASSVLWMLPNNMLREFFGVIKDFAVGNL